MINLLSRHRIPLCNRSRNQAQPRAYHFNLISIVESSLSLFLYNCGCVTCAPYFALLPSWAVIFQGYCHIIIKVKTCNLFSEDTKKRWKKRKQIFNRTRMAHSVLCIWLDWSIFGRSIFVISTTCPTMDLLSIQSIRFFDHIRIFPILIVCLSSLLFCWATYV